MSLSPDNLLPELGIPWSIRVHARARRLRLSINEQGARLTMPPGVDPLKARRFVERNREWLKRHWTPLAPLAAARELGLRQDGSEQLLFRGQRVRLQIDPCSAPQVAFDGVLRVGGAGSDAAGTRRLHILLVQWLRVQASADAQRYIQHHAPKLGWPHSVRLRALRSLWGSLSARGAMSLDLALIGAAPAVFEYVVVHELAHLTERNHGPRFWALVAQQLPDWQVQRSWLRENGAALKLEWSRIERRDLPSGAAI